MKIQRYILPVTSGIQLTLFGKVTVRTRRSERPARRKRQRNELEYQAKANLAEPRPGPQSQLCSSTAA